jgi:2-methylcitrate dehydratase PrpD
VSTGAEISVTRSFADALVKVPSPAGLAAAAASRTLLNVLGTAIGASNHPGTVALTGPAGRPGAIVVPGRREPLGILDAAAAIGFAAHVEDFDDTDLVTVLHPGAPVLGACLAAGQHVACSGRELLDAFAIGCEAQMRLARSISPSHYDLGWHITGTCGVVGAAVGAGLLLRLDGRRLRDAIGFAVAQTLGHREAFGTMLKAYHPGKAASNGLLAAWLAHRGLAGPDDPLGGPGGFAAVLSQSFDPGMLTRGLGEEWVLESNSFKPYPCGIVCHPAIDAGIALHGKVKSADAIAGVTVGCHPLVLELTGNPDPKDGLEAKFSTVHGVAAGLADGQAGLAQYTDSAVRSESLAALRGKISLVIDSALDRDQATATLITRDGHVLTQRVTHARGSLRRPLTDDELLAKVTALVQPVLPGRAPRIASAVHDLAGSRTLAALVGSLTAPAPAGAGNESGAGND